MTAAAGDLILAIDLGTSGPKVGLFDEAGALVGWTFEPVPLHLARGGAAEQDPADWWAAIGRAARRLWAERPAAAARIAGIACTAQWAGTVAVDAEGRALGPAIIWLDTRGAPYVQRVVRGLVSISGYDPLKLFGSWIRLNGNAPDRSGKDPIGHLLFLKHERPEIFSRARWFLEPKDYLNLRLTGQARATFDSINLHSLTDNRNIDRVVYDERLFRLVGLDPDRFPPLIRAIDRVGELTPAAAADLGLPAGLPVIGGAPDLHATGVGSGAVLDYHPHLYLGTSSWLSCFIPYKKTSLFNGIAALPSAAPGRYMVANSQEYAAGTLEVLLNNLVYPADELALGARPDDAFERLDRAAAGAPPGSGRVLFLPWLYGERTPVYEAFLRGGFINLSPRTQRAHLARAVMEGVAYNTRWLLESVEAFVERRLDDLRLVGGGAQSALWRQIMADVLDRRILQVEQPRLVSLRGAAFLGLVGLGYRTFAELPDIVRIAGHNEPDPHNRALYDEMYAAFRQAYKATRKFYRRFNVRRGVGGAG